MKRRDIAAEAERIADRLDELKAHTARKGHPVAACWLADAAEELRRTAWFLAKQQKEKKS